MKIFQFESPEKGELAQPVEDEDFEVFRTLDGSPRGSTWTPIRMKLVREDEFGRPYSESDFPWLGSHAPIMRKRAREALGDLASQYGEFLPLACDDAKLCVLNVCNVADALDLERSTISYFSSGKMMGVDAYVFRPEALQGVQIFKIPQRPRGGPVFVNEDVVDLVQQAGLLEVGFRLLWDGADPERAAFSIDDIFTRMWDDG
jgi:hypothetical protein